MQISPVMPTSQRLPSSRWISTVKRGFGLPIDPGRGFVFLRFAMESVVSVWPKPSKIVRPVCSFQKSNRSGLSASPAVVEYFSDDKSYSSKSVCIMRRYMVGGQHSVVIWYFWIKLRISSA